MRRPNHLLWLLPLLLLLAGVGAYIFGPEWLQKRRHEEAKKARNAQTADTATLPKGVRPDLKGHVHNKDGAPVAATVYIYSATPKTGPGTVSPRAYPDCRKTVQTDDQGDFRVESLDPQLTFRVLVAAKGYEPKFVNKVNPVKAIQVELKSSDRYEAGPARTVHGRVIDAKGDVVEGALVSPQGIRKKDGSQTWGGQDGTDNQAVTDEHGEFLLTSKDPIETMDVKVEANGYANKNFSELSSGSQSHDLVVTEGATITGRVTLKGKPLKGITVGIVSDNRRMEVFTGNFDVATDADGKFTFLNMPPNIEYNIYGTMNSLKEYGAIPVSKVHSGGDGETTKVGDLAVVPAFRLEGRVVLSDGKPVPAKSKLTLGREDAWDSLQIPLGTDGSFDATGIPGGSISVNARIQGYFASKKNASLDQLNPWRLVGHLDHDVTGLVFLLEKGKQPQPDYGNNFAGERQPWNLPLHGAEGGVDHSHDWQVTGVVTDGETQQPLEHFTVIPGNADSMWGRSQWDRQNAVEGTNGQFSIFFDKRWSQPMLQIKADGYIPGRVNIVPLEQTNASLALKKGGGISGAVRTADGKIVTDATVLLICEGDQQMNLGEDGKLQAYWNRTRLTNTDSNGRFSYAPELGMQAFAAASSAGFSLVSIDSFKTNANIIIEPYGSIKGTLKRKSGPGTNEDLDLQFAGQFRGPRAGLYLQNHSRTDEQGHFEFKNVPAGTLTVSYREYMGEGRMNGWSQQQLAEVTVIGGATLETNIVTDDLPKKDKTQENFGFRQPEPVLVPGQHIKGKVLLPNGKPAADTQVALQLRNRYLALGKASFSGGGNEEDIVTTNPKGEFTLPMYEEAIAVMALNETGFAHVTVQELKASPQITLQPWGRIEGTLHIGRHLGTNQVVVLSAGGFDMDQINFEFNAFQARTDDQGHFVMTYVPPGERPIARLVPMGNGAQMHQPVGMVTVKAGGITTADVGGTGQSITGRAKLPDTTQTVDWKRVQGSLHTEQPKLEDPKLEALKTQEEKMAYQSTPEFREKMKVAYKNFHSYPLTLSEGGSFTAEEIPPGNYEMDLHQFNPGQRFNGYEQIGHGEVTVAKNDSTNDVPVDLGTIELKKPEPLPGQGHPMTVVSKTVSAGHVLKSETNAAAK